MRILNICQDDWARFSYDNMRSLRSVGIDCDAVALNEHKFYKDQSAIITREELFKLIKEYDVIQYFHDNLLLFQNLYSELEKKKVIVYHTSSFYRKNYVQVNAIMNPITHKSVAAMPEFIGLGAKEELYMVGAVDTDNLVPNMYPIRYKFAHFPSNPGVKGTDTIAGLMNQLNVQFIYSKEIVDYDSQIRRISECEVYIEMCTEVDGSGSPYGNFGITALEAAALGKVVITQNNLNEDVYGQYYGFCALNFAKHSDKLKRLVQTFDNYNGSYLHGQQQITREWVVKNHSFKATGEYILKHILL